MNYDTVPYSSHKGSLWSRWDLHFHTPSSYDYENFSVSNDQIVEQLLASDIRVVAITDHHCMDIERIRSLQELGGNRLTVLPGIELRDDHGSKPVHYICIFPEDCDLEHVWTTLQGKLSLTSVGIANEGGDDRIVVPIEQGAKVCRDLGGVVSIHAGGKSNSIEGIGNAEQFQQQIKLNITKEWVDLLEIGQIKDIHRYLNKVFPNTGLDHPLILCSDNHNVNDYTVKANLWLKAEPTFRGLLMVLREPRERVYIGPRPPELIQRDHNPTKYINSLSFIRKANASSSDKWFTQTIEFNSGLVAIIGNKGSGKSALADTLGLLGSSKNGDSFSFLTKERFLHPVKGFAPHFTATITWGSGEPITRCLAEQVKLEEVERVKYLPQDYVETVCNELDGTGESTFEKELKAVIFSHVPESFRLSQTTLDDLLRFQTGEKQKRIDSLLKQLRELSRKRALLESQREPSERLILEERLDRQKKELEAHENNKPAEQPNPGQNLQDPTLLEELNKEEATKKELDKAITTATSNIKNADIQRARADRLLEKIANFEKEFLVFKSSLDEDAELLQLTPTDLVTFSTNTVDIKKIRDAATEQILSLRKQLDDESPPGMRSQVAVLLLRVSAIQAKLDAPNRAYQDYLKDLASWQDKKDKLLGKADDPESIVGLKASLAAIDQLPNKILEVTQAQIDLALEIYREKRAQVEIYGKLYGPVQEFINSHELAKNKLQLEFRVELANQDFTGRFLALLAQNRRGSFMGIDEGHAYAQELCQNAKWNDEQSIREFLEQVDEALHFDHRDPDRKPIQLTEQLLKGRKTEEVFDLLYGLEYIQPRYILRWEGKDLSILSPGERGTLLLIFYLLIDKGDMPLIIDQPEGNLDNQTVAKVLIDCIREARKRRQVFLVTHNPNLAVVCDADQVIYAEMNKTVGNAVTYSCGALESPEISRHVTDVLEGTRWAFDKRSSKYDVGKQQ